MSDLTEVLARDIGKSLGLLGRVPDASLTMAAQSILVALDAAGYQIVPKEPTPDMISAGSDHKRWGREHFGDPGYAPCGNIYSAMLAAAPKP